MPPNRPNSRVGRNCRAVVTPTAVALPVRLSTSQSWAIRCTQVPVLENSWPVANNRKFRVRSELKTEWGAGSERGEAGRGGLAVAVTNIQIVVVRYLFILAWRISLRKEISPI